MSFGLSPAARQQAEKIRAALRSGQETMPFSARQMQRPSLRELQRWCDAQGVGGPLRADGGWGFSVADLVQLEEALRNLGLRPLDVPAADTRIGRLRQGAEEHKGLGDQPLAHRVLCSQAAAGMALPVREQPARWAIDVDWRLLDRAAFAGLLVVENADVFYACGSVDWRLSPALERFLIVYRGHGYRSHGLKELQAAWRPMEGPQAYFGDLDPPGLRIALTEGYTHVLVPAWPAFHGAATRAHVPTRQSTELRWLQTRALPACPADHPLAPYLQQVARGRGLLQQAALRLPLVLINVPPGNGGSTAPDQ